MTQGKTPHTTGTKYTSHKTQDTRHKTQDTRHKREDTRHKTHDTRHKTQDTRHKTHKTQITRHKTQDTRTHNTTHDSTHPTQHTQTQQLTRTRQLDHSAFVSRQMHEFQAYLVQCMASLLTKHKIRVLGTCVFVKIKSFLF
jgi:hypothetical protein